MVADAIGEGLFSPVPERTYVAVIGPGVIVRDPVGFLAGESSIARCPGTPPDDLPAKKLSKPYGQISFTHFMPKQAQ